MLQKVTTYPYWVLARPLAYYEHLDCLIPSSAGIWPIFQYGVSVAGVTSITGHPFCLLLCGYSKIFISSTDTKLNFTLICCHSATCAINIIIICTLSCVVWYLRSITSFCCREIKTQLPYYKTMIARFNLIPISKCLRTCVCWWMILFCKLELKLVIKG